MVSEILKVLAEKNFYLVLIFDGEYKQFISEILDPYGQIQSAGLSEDLEKALKEAIDFLNDKEKSSEE